MRGTQSSASIHWIGHRGEINPGQARHIQPVVQIRDIVTQLGLASRLRHRACATCVELSPVRRVLDIAESERIIGCGHRDRGVHDLMLDDLLCAKPHAQCRHGIRRPDNGKQGRIENGDSGRFQANHKVAGIDIRREAEMRLRDVAEERVLTAPRPGSQID